VGIWVLILYILTGFPARLSRAHFCARIDTVFVPDNVFRWGLIS